MADQYPSLSYGFLRQSGEGILGVEDVTLATVNEVTAWRHDDAVTVHARGRLLRLDGTPSRVNRSVKVDTRGHQPKWLRSIIDDAMRRLDKAV